MRWLLLLLVAACAMKSSSTKLVATFGYMRTPSVALATRGAPDYHEALRASAHRGLPALVDLEAAPDAALCEAA